MVLIPASSVTCAAALLPVVAGRAPSDRVSGKRCSPSMPGKAGQARWQGHVLLAVAVVLWLALMNAGLHGGGGTQSSLHGLQHSGMGVFQLQDLGRMLLAR
jgi:hypothetical protein